MKSVLFAQQAAELVFLIAAQLQFLAVGQNDSVVAMEPGLNFTNALQVDDGGTMNAHKTRWIKLALHVTHVAA